jgi:hypothetical protein
MWTYSPATSWMAPSVADFRGNLALQPAPYPRLSVPHASNVGTAKRLFL